MKIKKFYSLLLAVFMLLSVVIVPFCASAIVTADSGVIKILPGNTQSSSPVYSNAWLDNVVIRDGVNSFKSARMVPKAAYPYSHTFSEFVTEVDHYSILHELNENTATTAYSEIVNALYYLVTALGMTDDTDAMAVYLKDNGITLPSNPTTSDKATIAVVYAAIKYNAVYTLYNKQVTLPKGITLDAAEIIILSEITGVFLPSGVDTLTGFAVQAMKTHVEEFDQIPLSNNPGPSEIFHWVKVIAAAAKDYKLPLTPYDQATQAEKDYVDYAYYATIFETIYDVHINPAALAVADNNTSDMYAVQKAILQAMLEAKGKDYPIGTSCEDLFKMACECGYFQLEEEFYSDVFDYDVYVASDCEKLWFTPFALASQLNSDNKYVTIYLDDKEMKPSGTTFAQLDLSKQSQDVQMQVLFDDGVKRESVTYMFHTIRTNETTGQSSENSNNLVGQLETAIGNVVPSDNEKVNGILDSVKNSVGDVMESFPTFPSLPASIDENTLSTYSGEITTDPGYTGQADKANDGVDFNYLGSLLENTYADSEITTAGQSETSAFANANEAAQSVFTRTVNVIKENPQIAIAPTGIVAVGGLVGYFFNKKRKDTIIPDEITEETDEI